MPNKNFFLDMVWPALYVFATFWQFWYLVICTIVLELVVIRFFLKFSWKLSLKISIIGNFMSSVFGTFLMMFLMLFYHMFADLFIQGTFATFNLIATYVLMCVGSVILETIVAKAICKESFRKLFLPMLTGNLLSYALIAYVMLSDPDNYFKG